MSSSRVGKKPIFMEMSHRVLVVEDSPDVQALVRHCLKDDFALSFASSIAEGKRALERERFDLVILDVQLPDGDGFAFCASLQTQARYRDLPIFFLTGETSTDSKVMGFQLGASDYIAKPFNPAELRARVLARVRRGQQERQGPEQQRVGDLRLDLAAHQAYLCSEGGGEQSLNLSPLEFKLLHYFSRHQEHVLTRNQLIDAVWGTGVYILDRTVDTHVSHLRKKLAGSEYTLRTAHGAGYSFELSAQRRKVS